MVFELIFSKEKDGLDFIFSGVVNYMLFFSARRFESTEDLMWRS